MPLITKNGNKQISPHFSEHELRSRSWEKGYTDLPNQFWMEDWVINGLETIRNYYGVPIIIHSTGRSPKHNSAEGGASKSQHIIKEYMGSPEKWAFAIDFRFQGQDVKGSAGYNASEDFYTQIKNKSGALYDGLLKKFVKGFGLYNNFYHIDTRGVYDNPNQEVVVWDDSTRNQTVVESIYNMSGEDGYKAVQEQSVRWGLIVVVMLIVVLVGVLVYKKYKKK